MVFVVRFGKSRLCECGVTSPFQSRAFRRERGRWLCVIKVGHVRVGVHGLGELPNPSDRLRPAAKSGDSMSVFRDVAADLAGMEKASTLDHVLGCFQKLTEPLAPYHSLLVNFGDVNEFNPARMRDSRRSCQQHEYLRGRRAADVSIRYVSQHRGLNVFTSEEAFEQCSTAELNRWERTYMRPEGWNKFVDMPFWRGKVQRAMFCIRRAPDQPHFSHQELELIRELRQLMTPRLHRLFARQALRQRQKLTRSFIEELPFGLMIISWELLAVHSNRRARLACEEWKHGARAAAMKVPSRPHLPPELLEACRRLRDLADYRETGKHEPVIQVHCALTPTLMACCKFSTSTTGQLARPFIAVRFLRVPTRDKAPIITPALWHLSPNELRVGLLVARGMADKEIASTLGKSIHTVKSQLASAFRKTRLNNRTQLATALNQLPTELVS
jgi:DNA-binding CsgD family transcriptional regulator